LDGYNSWKDQGEAIVGTTIDIIQKWKPAALRAARNTQKGTQAE
jgi:hypothetical protein